MVRRATSVQTTCGCLFLSFPRAGMGMLSHMGKNNRNPDLKCKKSLIMTAAGDKVSNIYLDVRKIWLKFHVNCLQK